MLLTCPKCATRYEVDGSSIPQEGTYAHCATCENIFFVKKKVKSASKDAAKTTMPATQEPPTPQPVEARAEAAPEATTQSAEAEPAPELPPPPAKGKDGKERKDLTPEQVAAIMSGIEYEGKTKTEGNDSTELTAQDQIDSILGNVHEDFKVITAPLPSPAAEKTAMNAGDIEMLLASVQAQRPEEPAPAPKKEEPKTATASDIDDIFASVQAQQPPAPKKEEPKTATASDIDDIFASVQAQQAPAPKPAAKEAVGADDIAAILASVQAQQPPAPNNIDAIFAGGNAAPSAGKMDSQDDIDAILMTAAAPAPRESILEQEAVSSTQAISNDDIDSILTGAATEKESSAPAAPQGDAGIISQSDLDSLFAAAAAPSAPAAEKPSKETEGDLISQNDLDALLGETKAPPAAEPASGDLVSQGDLDALMTGEGAPKAAAPVSAGQLLEEGNDELESLFTQEAGGSIATPAAAPKGATAAAPAAEYEGVDTSMFEGLDKVTAEEAPAAAEEHRAEVERKPGTLSNIIAFIKNKLPKRKEKAQEFAATEDTSAETDHGETPKKKKAGMLAKIALPAAAGVALTLGAGWYYFVKPKSHPVVAAQKTAAPEKTAAAPAQPAAEQQKETPAAETHAAPPPAHEEAKAEAPKVQPPPAHEEKKPEPPPAATAEAPKPKEAAAAAHEDARKAALEAEKLIPPSLVEATIMKVGVMLPVDFNSSQVKMMTAEVELQFATASEFKTAETKKFIYELALENEIEVFFKDKFYEETRYAKDKLMAYLFERIKKRGDLEKITGVNIAELALK